MSSLSTWPTAIYLQHSEDGYQVPEFKAETDFITWNETPIYDCDIEYVRADLAAALPVLLEVLQELLNAFDSQMRSYEDLPVQFAARAAIARATGGQP
jgi:hypothetical protein